MIRIKKPLLVLAVMAASSCATIERAAPVSPLEQALIVGRSVIPPYTGFVPSWIEYKVRRKRSDVVVLLPHFDNGRPLPEVGATCDISFQIQHVRGQVGDKISTVESANVIDSIKCNGS